MIKYFSHNRNNKSFLYVGVISGFIAILILLIGAMEGESIWPPPIIVNALFALSISHFIFWIIGCIIKRNASEKKSINDKTKYHNHRT